MQLYSVEFVGLSQEEVVDSTVLSSSVWVGSEGERFSVEFVGLSEEANTDGQ